MNKAVRKFIDGLTDEQIRRAVDTELDDGDPTLVLRKGVVWVQQGWRNKLFREALYHAAEEQ